MCWILGVVGVALLLVVWFTACGTLEQVVVGQQAARLNRQVAEAGHGDRHPARPHGGRGAGPRRLLRTAPPHVGPGARRHLPGPGWEIDGVFDAATPLIGPGTGLLEFRWRGVRVRAETVLQHTPDIVRAQQ
ncbi:MAG TPA: hypothetical protein VJY40_03410 [Corynebacterium sp.]|nr:hypothetical protein [Corynebacterium sp.]